MNDTEPEPDWEVLAKALLADQLRGATADVNAAFHKAVDATRDDELTPDHIRELRSQMNDARLFIETYLAPAAGCKPWGRPQHPMPVGVARDVYGMKPEHDCEPGSE